MQGKGLNRRALLAVCAAAGLAAALPSVLHAATPRKPARLRPGDVVSVIAPAKVGYEKIELEYAADIIRALGLEPRFGASVSKRFGYLAGLDRERAGDINAAFADSTVSAVFAMRGGWGSGRLLPLLDYPLIARNPKILLGYSDITALLLALQARSNLVGIHGPNILSDWNPYVVDLLRRLLFHGEALEYRPWRPETKSLATLEGRIQTLVPGSAEGVLIGGNLTVLAALVGTPYMPSLDGALLFLEDVHEPVYRIDRALTQLRLAGLLERVNGIVFGAFRDVPAETGLGDFALHEILEQHSAAAGKPAFMGASFGHVLYNSPLPLGVRARMDAGSGVLRLLDAAVS